MNRTTAHIHGHRGARGVRPENTLPAIECAFAERADGVEIDVCVSADRRLIVHHDLRLNPAHTRDANGDWIKCAAPIIECTLRQLRRFDVGRLKPGGADALRFAEQVAADGAHIPTLDECIALFMRLGDARSTLNIELKSDPRAPQLTPPTERYVELLLDQLAHSNAPHERLFIQSFDWQLMRAVKTAAPQLRVAATGEFADANDALAFAQQHRFDALSCDYRAADAALINRAHQLGLKVCAWTANDSHIIQQLAANGVDIITTDYPHRARRALYPRESSRSGSVT